MAEKMERIVVMAKAKGTIASVNQAIMFYSLGLLVVFLPLASWLVSLTGKTDVSLGRDLLVGIIVITALVGNFGRLKEKKFAWPWLALIILGLASYFWREASPWQWLRGFRFTFLPIGLFGALLLTDFGEKKQLLYKVIFWESVVILALAGLELAGARLPLVTRFSGTGVIDSVHMVGGIKTIRLQAVLAGPNALGLYLLALLSYGLGVFRYLGRKRYYFVPAVVVVMLLTYSRSAIIGAMAILLAATVMYLRKKYGLTKSLFISGAGLIVVAALALVLYQIPRTRDFITHQDSNLRLIQYERIWNTKYDIGFWGRGMGTAGPASQYRLDGGPNRWTENIYLDTFEQLGLAGLILWIAGLIVLLKMAWKKVNTGEGRSTVLAILGFGVAGLFINNYTGQVGIFLMFIISGLMIGADLKESRSAIHSP